MIDWILSTVLVVVAGSVLVYIFVRYPDFRRAFVAHWKPEAVAKRMSDWAERNRE